MSTYIADVMPALCAGCDVPTREPSMRNRLPYCERCASEIDAIAGVIAPIDPADIICISGYFANLPRQQVERIYRSLTGEVLVDVDPRGYEAFERPDVVTYAYSIVERTVRGETSEYVSLREVDE
jgi:hypothetical protein